MKILKKLFVMMLLFAICTAAHAEEKQVSVLLNDQPVAFGEVAPQIVDGRTMVPLRAIFEALGTQVYWDESSKTVTSIKDGTIILLQIDNNILFKNEEHIALDVAPVIIGDRTMIPLRAVSESFGLSVEWNEENYQVLIKG